MGSFGQNMALQGDARADTASAADLPQRLMPSAAEPGASSADRGWHLSEVCGP